jgi:hypothetical protein
MRRLTQFLVMLALLLLALPANAAIITWSIEGVITDSPPGNQFENILPVGTEVDFLVRVDTNAPDMCADPSVGFYAAPPASVSFGGSTYTSSETFFEVNQAIGSCLAFDGVVARFIFDQMVAPFWLGTLGWVGPLGESLPTTPPEDGFFWFAYIGFDPEVTGRITSSEVVPEPSSLLLALSGLAAIRLRRLR